MIHHLVINDKWEDPGVTAYDLNDGDLTNTVRSFGAGAVTTSATTPTNSPWVISYDVQDKAGKGAVTTRRRIYVTNPCAGQGVDGTDEIPCPADDDGAEAQFCSNAGICASLAIADEDTPAPEPPSIELVGPTNVRPNTVSWLSLSESCV